MKQQHPPPPPLSPLPPTSRMGTVPRTQPSGHRTGVGGAALPTNVHPTGHWGPLRPLLPPAAKLASAFTLQPDRPSPSSVSQTQPGLIVLSGPAHLRRPGTKRGGGAMDQAGEQEDPPCMMTGHDRPPLYLALITSPACLLLAAP